MSLIPRDSLDKISISTITEIHKEQEMSRIKKNESYSDDMKEDLELDDIEVKITSDSKISPVKATKSTTADDSEILLNNLNLSTESENDNQHVDSMTTEDFSFLKTNLEDYKENLTSQGKESKETKFFDNEELDALAQLNNTSDYSILSKTAQNKDSSVLSTTALLNHMDQMADHGQNTSINMSDYENMVKGLEDSFTIENVNNSLHNSQSETVKANLPISPIQNVENKPSPSPSTKNKLYIQPKDKARPPSLNISMDMNMDSSLEDSIILLSRQQYQQRLSDEQANTMEEKKPNDPQAVPSLPMEGKKENKSTPQSANQTFQPEKEVSSMLRTMNENPPEQRASKKSTHFSLSPIQEIHQSPTTDSNQVQSTTPERNTNESSTNHSLPRTSLVSSSRLSEPKKETKRNSVPLKRYSALSPASINQSIQRIRNSQSFTGLNTFNDLNFSFNSDESIPEDTNMKTETFMNLNLNTMDLGYQRPVLLPSPTVSVSTITSQLTNEIKPNEPSEPDLDTPVQNLLHRFNEVDKEHPNTTQMNARVSIDMNLLKALLNQTNNYITSKEEQRNGSKSLDVSNQQKERPSMNTMELGSLTGLLSQNEDALKTKESINISEEINKMMADHHTNELNKSLSNSDMDITNTIPLKTMDDLIQENKQKTNNTSSMSISLDSTATMELEKLTSLLSYQLLHEDNKAVITEQKEKQSTTDRLSLLASASQPTDSGAVLSQIRQSVGRLSLLLSNPVGSTTVGNDNETKMSDMDITMTNDLTSITKLLSSYDLNNKSIPDSMNSQKRVLENEDTQMESQKQKVMEENTLNSSRMDMNNSTQDLEPLKDLLTSLTTAEKKTSESAPVVSQSMEERRQLARQSILQTQSQAPLFAIEEEKSVEEKSSEPPNKESKVHEDTTGDGTQQAVISHVVESMITTPAPELVVENPSKQVSLDSHGVEISGSMMSISMEDSQKQKVTSEKRLSLLSNDSDASGKRLQTDISCLYESQYIDLDSLSEESPVSSERSISKMQEDETKTLEPQEPKPVREVDRLNTSTLPTRKEKNIFLELKNKIHTKSMVEKSRLSSISLKEVLRSPQRTTEMDTTRSVLQGERTEPLDKYNSLLIERVNPAVNSSLSLSKSLFQPTLLKEGPEEQTSSLPKPETAKEVSHETLLNVTSMEGKNYLVAPPRLSLVPSALSTNYYSRVSSKPSSKEDKPTTEDSVCKLRRNNKE